MAYMTKNDTFKTTILSASLCDYSGAYILVQGRITVVGPRANSAAIAKGINNKEVAFKRCGPFIKVHKQNKYGRSI